MTAPEILSQLQPIFRDVLDNPGLTVTMDDSASTVEGWDSLSHISLISAVEGEFKVRFALGELQELKNVGELVELIGHKLP